MRFYKLRKKILFYIFHIFSVFNRQCFSIILLPTITFSVYIFIYICYLKLALRVLMNMFQVALNFFHYINGKCTKNANGLTYCTFYFSIETDSDPQFNFFFVISIRDKTLFRLLLTERFF